MRMIYGEKIISFGIITLVIILCGCLSQSVSAQWSNYMSNQAGDCPQASGVDRGTRFHSGVDPDGGWVPKGKVRDWWGPMPQTNYTPRYGCYPGNARTIHRYPAFHGYYYRAPYNYRLYSEFPWHADMAEPQPYPAQVMENEENSSEYYDGQEIIIHEEILSPSNPVSPRMNAPTPAPVQNQ
ncbi:MAG: hypothetical protein Q4C96_03980 [Planctomycetia bacterium]|nr:hypothetical protein [Planctomycetia bacterium]